MFHDLRHAVRALARRPGFALSAILTLALGIGATTAIFSVVSGVLLRELPYREPDALVTITAYQSWPDVRDILEWSTSYASAGGSALQNLDWIGGEEPLQIQTALVTGKLFETLGVPPAIGRTISADDDREGAANVVVLSHGFWTRRLGHDPLVIGRALQLSGKSYTIIGVMPEDFRVPERNVELFAPLQVVQHEAASHRGVHFLRTVWRLRAGVTRPQAQAEMARLDQRLAEVDPQENRGRQRELQSLAELLVGDVRTALWILLGAVTMVLLVGGTNFANLLLARSVGRGHELAIRSSIGASRVRLVRQLLTESLVLAFAGGALGVLFATWGLDLLLALQPDVLPRLEEVRVDTGVLGFALLITIGAGIVFGLLPALNASREALTDTLKQGGGTSTTGAGAHRLLDGMVVAQLALALVLLVGAGLLLHGLWKLHSVRPGFDPQGVLTMRTELPPSRYEGPEAMGRYRHAVVEAVGSIPGAQVGLVSELPLSGAALMHNFIIDGRPPVTPGDEPELMSRSVAGDYFAAMRMPVIEGRVFEAGDRAGSLLVGVVNESFVRTYFRGSSPVGGRIRWSHDDGQPRWITIVGVVADVKHFGLDQDEQPAVYSPYEQLQQTWKNWQCVIARGPNVTSAGMVGRIKERIWSVDPQVPITELRPMTDVIGASLARQNFNLVLIAIFASVALLLACFGLYGVASYVAERRTREIGLRLALGADRHDVLRLVLGRSMRLVGIGVAIGLAGAVLLTRLMQSMLYQVSAHDPLTYAAVAATLGAVAIVASAVPAARASRVDPVVALRSE